MALHMLYVHTVLRYIDPDNSMCTLLLVGAKGLDDCLFYVLFMCECVCVSDQRGRVLLIMRLENRDRSKEDWTAVVICIYV